MGLCVLRYLHTFNNPDGFFYCKQIIEYDHEMLVYKLSDDINHRAMHWEFAESQEKRKCLFS